MSSFNVTNNNIYTSDEIRAYQTCLNNEGYDCASDCDMTDDELFNSVVTVK